MGKHSLFAGTVSATVAGINWSVSSCKCSMNIRERKHLQLAHTYKYSSAVIANWLLKQCNSSMKSINGRSINTLNSALLSPASSGASWNGAGRSLDPFANAFNPSFPFYLKSISDCIFIFISAFLGQNWTPWEAEEKNLNSTLSPATVQKAPMRAGARGIMPLRKSTYSDVL